MSEAAQLAVVPASAPVPIGTPAPNTAPPPPPAEGQPALTAPVQPPGTVAPELPAWAKDYPAELQQTVAGAKWKDPKDAVESYFNLRKLESGEKIALPKDPDDPAWAKVHQRLGAYEKPEDYVAAVKVAEGDPAIDPTFVSAMAERAAKAGVTARQWEGIVQGYQEFAKGIMANQPNSDAEFAKAETADLETLKREWTGPAWDQNVAAAQRMTQALGLDQDDVTAVMKAIGVKKTLAAFAQGGSKFGVELPFRDGNSPGNGMMTPEMAKARIAELSKDPMWRKAYTEGGMESREFKEMSNLTKIASEG
jgi:hypothetical protein